jgi:hypothetical protein
MRKIDILQEIHIPRSNPATWSAVKGHRIPSTIETRCLTAQLKIIRNYYSDTSANEDNSFRNHIR